MDAFEILVIVLSVLLGILLIVGIVVGILFVKIIKDIRNITEKASLAADNIEHVAELFKNTSSVAAITKVVANAVHMFKKNKE